MSYDNTELSLQYWKRKHHGDEFTVLTEGPVSSSSPNRFQMDTSQGLEDVLGWFVRMRVTE